MPLVRDGNYKIFTFFIDERFFCMLWNGANTIQGENMRGMHDFEETNDYVTFGSRYLITRVETELKEGV